MLSGKDVMEERECIRLAAAGDMEAFKRLYDRYFGSVSASIMRIVKDCHDAEDIVQESFLAARGKLGSFRGTGSFEGWLRRIGINCALDFLERRKRMTPTDGQELEGMLERQQGNGGAAGSHIDGEAFETAFQQAVAGLPAEFRETFSLAVIEQTPYAEVASALDISRELVKVRVFRARKLLQETLKSFTNR